MTKNNANIVWHFHHVIKKDRLTQKKQHPFILWFTGLSGSGKSTIAGAVERRLFEMGCHTYLLDGDNIRHGLNKDLDLSDGDRIENIRRIGEVSNLFLDAGLIVLTAFISPFRSDRRVVRDLVSENEFIEVYVDTPLATCEQRDPKGLYRKARKGEIKNFTGIDSTYEVPEAPEIVINTAESGIEECVDKIIEFLKKNQIVSKH